MVAIGALVALAALVVAAGAATIQWVLAVHNRTSNIAWWKALVSGGGLTEKGRQHRLRGSRLVLLALGLWLTAAFLATLLICCTPPN